MTLQDIIDRLRLPFRGEEKTLYQALFDIVGFYPNHIEYYKLALMHKSVSRRNEKGRPLNNERLEFLGDAMLDAVVGDIVYHHFEGKREGFLTNTRSKLVSRDTLGKLAIEMGLTKLILSSGHNNSHNSYMAGNAFEALVGAIYLDKGYDGVMRFMKTRILTQLINIDKVAYKEVNFKSKLLEWSQKNRVRMEFRMLKQAKEKASGSPVFRYRVVLEGVEGESGEGYSKKESQQLASEATLKRLRREPQFVDAIFAAKTSRTQMEEEPAMAVPDTEQQADFIIQHDEKPAEESRRNRRARTVTLAPQPQPATQAADGNTNGSTDEFDLSDITAAPKEKTREDIIAEAEAAAFANE